MGWHRLGRVYEPQSRHPALLTHAALPVAAPLGGELVRVFFSGRDQRNRSSVASLLLRLGDRPRVEDAPYEPILLPGTLGAFDDAGIGVGSVIPDPRGDRLYYMGWNVGGSVPWRNAIGLAIGSIAEGRFERYAAGPIMDRDPIDPFSLSYPWVHREGESDWRMWYGTHLAWGADKADMNHAIRAATSLDGLAWRRDRRIAICPESGEIAAVRPTVVMNLEGAEMWFARRGHGEYQLGYARSDDKVTWTRIPQPVWALPSNNWEGGVITYPCVFDAAGRRWMLYNGANYGAAGIGLAVWES